MKPATNPEARLTGMARPRRWLISLSALVLSLLLSGVGGAIALVPVEVPAVSGPPWGVWQRSTVETEDSISPISTAIAVDSDGRPHIVHTTRLGDAVAGAFYYRSTGIDTWEREMLSPSATGFGVTVGADDTIHAAYGTFWPSNIMYTKRTLAGDWTHETVLTDSSSSEGVILVDDATGVVHLVHSAGSSGLRHSIRDPMTSTWSSDWITQETTAGSSNDAALDSQGRLHVTYRVASSFWGGTGYAVLTLSGWQRELVQPECGSFVAMALDSKDLPHLLCSHGAIGMQHWWKSSAGAWQWEWVIQGYGKGIEPALAIDEENRLHVTYRNLYNLAWHDDPTRPGQLQYAVRQADGSWFVETADRVGSANGYSSDIALDAGGRPHLSHVIAWMSSSLPRGPPNQSYDLMYATPAVTLLPKIG